MWQTILGSLMALVLALLLARQLIRRSRQQADEPQRLFGAAQSVLESPLITEGQTAGTYRLAGRYEGYDVQAKAVTDTLALRKLPSLWLLVTLPGPVPVSATLDLMMRPTGPTTFSNFDDLPSSVPTPAGFPEHAVIRSDNPALMPPTDLVRPLLPMFFGPRAKELLITPRGVRLVVLLAEADRARYGVFRQADFGEVSVDPDLLRDCIEHLITLRSAIDNWQKQPS